MAKVRILSGSEPATLIEKNITANGTYNASADDADGYSSVVVNVPGHNIYVYDREPLSSEGVNGDAFIQYSEGLQVTLSTSIVGGYNGNAPLICKVDDVTVINATGSVPYNLDYTQKFGAYFIGGHTITVQVTPPANSTALLYINWYLDNTLIWTESISPAGSNTSFGYNTIENSPAYVTTSTVVLNMYYKQNNVWITQGDNININ